MKKASIIVCERKHQRLIMFNGKVKIFKNIIIIKLKKDMCEEFKNVDWAAELCKN